MLPGKIKTISNFLRKNKLNYGIVITKDKIGLEGNVLLFPMLYFLLMC